MNLLRLALSPLLVAPLLAEGTRLRSSSTNSASTQALKDERRVIEIPIKTQKFTEDQRQMLLDNINDMVVKDIMKNGTKNKRTFLRKLAEGDWEFLNMFFESLDLSAEINQTFDFGRIEFTVGVVSCTDFRISDIITSASGSSTQQDLSFLVTGITVTCQLDYSYSAGFPIGSGSGNLEMDISSDSNIETILSFISDNFNTDPPTTSTLTCKPDIEIADISFSNFWLNLIVAPFLPNVMEPLLEPTICEPLGIVESVLSDAVLMISDVLDELVDPIPPELTDKLVPEMTLFNEYQDPIYVDFVKMQPIVDFLANPIKELVELISSSINPPDGGPIRIPVNMPLDGVMGAVVNEIRISGLDNFTFDSLSLKGNHTLSTTYEIDNVSFEIDMEVSDSNGGTDTVIIKFGVHDIVSDFALLLVIEQSIMDAAQIADPIIDTIMNLDFNDIDYDAIYDSIALVVTEIISSIDFSGINDIAQFIELISNIDIIELISKIDLAVFEGVIEIIEELVNGVEEFDIIKLLNHVADSIFAIEIASFSLTSSGIDAPEISGLTQFIGPQNMINEISDVVFYMYQSTLINVVDFFLQSTTRSAVNDLIKDSFVYDTCLEEFAGTTVHVPSATACWKVELFDGGEISVDSSDPDCSKDLHVGEHFSYYRSSSENEAYFVGNWTGQVEFVENIFTPDLHVVSSIDEVNKIFTMTLTYPSCTQPFEVTTNVTEVSESTTSQTLTRRSLFEHALSYFFPQPEDEVLDWQK